MKKNPVSVATLFLVLSLSIQVMAASSDWPQWRGPDRDGHSSDTGLLKEWPKGGPKLLWKAKGMGIGYTNVSVVGDRLFLMGDKDDACYVIALKKANGQPLWTAKVGKSGAPGWGGFAGPRVTPTVDGKLVFAVGQWGDAACIDAENGKVLWSKDYAKDFGAQRPEWGFCGMPLVDGDQVILAPGGKNGDLVALNKKTGEVLWQSKELTDGIHYSSPIGVEIGGVRQYVQFTDASVAGIQRDNGHLLWRVDRKGATAVIPTPIYHDGFVYVSSGYGAGCNLFKITATDGKFSAKQVYANKEMTNHHGGVIRVDKCLYGFSDGKGWTCQDFETGKVVWKENSKLGKGSIAYADGMLYLRAEDDSGTVALIKASPEGYQEKGRFDQPDRSDKNSWPHPVVVGRRLYLRDQDILLCYDILQGK